MNLKIDLEISFSSLNSKKLLYAINNLRHFADQPPTLITAITPDGFTEFEGSFDWIDKWITKSEYGFSAYWGSIFKHEKFINYDNKEQTIKLKISNFELVNAQSVMEILIFLPLTIASFRRIYREGGWKKYRAPNFGSFHFPHGWACAFKGEGHNHLVSRRWLEYHPWHLIRDEENDISFVQFHDLDAEPAEALEQAKEGHRAMSMYGVGGYIGKTHPFSNDLRGVYLPDERNLRVVIPARKEITYSEMSDYCAARHFQAFSEGEIDLLSFVFIEGKEAQPYIKDLWLREIEVSGFTPKGKEIRLDEDYQPDYQPPQWVKKLQQQQQQTQIEEKKQHLAKVEKKIANLEGRIKNASGGKLTGSLNQNDALTSLRKQLQKELRKQRVVQQKLEREIAQLENNQN